jgi:hypothetical protein
VTFAGGQGGVSTTLGEQPAARNATTGTQTRVKPTPQCYGAPRAMSTALDAGRYWSGRRVA